MRDVAVRLDDFQGATASMAGVGAQMLAATNARRLALDHDGLQHCAELRNVMPIRPGHDERQWDATPVHQQMTLGSPFFPRSVRLGPTQSCTSGALNMAPSTLCHRQAIPSIWSYSASPAFHMASNTPRRSPTQGIACGLRWHCQSAPWEGPSTGSRCAAYTRLLRTLVGPVWPAVLPLACARTLCRQRAHVLGSAIRRAARNHWSPPRTQLACVLPRLRPTTA